MDTIALSLIGAIALVSAVTSAITIYLQTRPSRIADVADLERRVTSLQLQLNDTIDKFSTLEKRDRVRRMRERKAEQSDEDQDAEPTDPVQLRMALRRRAFGNIQG